MDQRLVPSKRFGTFPEVDQHSMNNDLNLNNDVPPQPKLDGCTKPPMTEYWLLEIPIGTPDCGIVEESRRPKQ
jgi:hypothetical protein